MTCAEIERARFCAAAKMIERLRGYVNLSYNSEATISAEMKVSWDALSGWLRGKSKPTFKSLLKVRQFLEHRPKNCGRNCTGWVCTATR